MEVREKWIDVLKGFAIFLIVLGHSTTDEALITILYSFHVPLFFFLSGYLYNTLKYKNKFRLLFSKRIINLLISYLVGCVVAFSYGFWSQEKTTFFEMIKGMLLANGNYFNQYSIPLWFIPCLIVTILIFWAMESYLKINKYEKFIFYLTFAILSIYVIKWFGKLPWGMDIVPVSLFFFYIGNLIKQSNIIKTIHCPMWLLFLILLLFVAGISLNGHVDIFGRGYGNITSYIFTSLMGIIISIAACLFIENNTKLFSKLFAYIGKITMVILIFHPICFNITFRIIQNFITVLHLTLPRWYEMWFIFTAGGLLLPVILYFIVIGRSNTLSILFNGRALKNYTN